MQELQIRKAGLKAVFWRQLLKAATASKSLGVEQAKC